MAITDPVHFVVVITFDDASIPVREGETVKQARKRVKANLETAFEGIAMDADAHVDFAGIASKSIIV